MQSRNEQLIMRREMELLQSHMSRTQPHSPGTMTGRSSRRLKRMMHGGSQGDDDESEYDSTFGDISTNPKEQSLTHGTAITAYRRNHMSGVSTNISMNAGSTISAGTVQPFVNHSLMPTNSNSKGIDVKLQGGKPLEEGGSGRLMVIVQEKQSSPDRGQSPIHSNSKRNEDTPLGVTPQMSGSSQSANGRENLNAISSFETQTSQRSTGSGATLFSPSDQSAIAAQHAMQMQIQLQQQQERAFYHHQQSAAAAAAAASAGVNRVMPWNTGTSTAPTEPSSSLPSQSLPWATHFGAPMTASRLIQKNPSVPKSQIVAGTQGAMVGLHVRTKSTDEDGEITGTSEAGKSSKKGSINENHPERSNNHGRGGPIINDPSPRAMLPPAGGMGGGIMPQGRPPFGVISPHMAIPSHSPMSLAQSPSPMALHGSPMHAMYGNPHGGPIPPVMMRPPPHLINPLAPPPIHHGGPLPIPLVPVRSSNSQTRSVEETKEKKRKKSSKSKKKDSHPKKKMRIQIDRDSIDTEYHGKNGTVTRNRGATETEDRFVDRTVSLEPNMTVIRHESTGIGSGFSLLSPEGSPAPPPEHHRGSISSTRSGKRKRRKSKRRKSKNRKKSSGNNGNNRRGTGHPNGGVAKARRKHRHHKTRLTKMTPINEDKGLSDTSGVPDIPSAPIQLSKRRKKEDDGDDESSESHSHSSQPKSSMKRAIKTPVPMGANALSNSIRSHLADRHSFSSKMSYTTSRNDSSSGVADDSDYTSTETDSDDSDSDDDDSSGSSSIDTDDESDDDSDSISDSGPDIPSGIRKPQEKKELKIVRTAKDEKLIFKDLEKKMIKQNHAVKRSVFQSMSIMSLDGALTDDEGEERGMQGFLPSNHATPVSPGKHLTVSAATKSMKRTTGSSAATTNTGALSPSSSKNSKGRPTHLNRNVSASGTSSNVSSFNTMASDTEMDVHAIHREFENNLKQVTIQKVGPTFEVPEDHSQNQSKRGYTSSGAPSDRSSYSFTPFESTDMDAELARDNDGDETTEDQPTWSEDIRAIRPKKPITA